MAVYISKRLIKGQNCLQEMVSAKPSGLVLFYLLKYYTTQVKLELRSRLKKVTVCFTFVKVVITNMYQLQFSLHVFNSCVCPSVSEMIIESSPVLINYKSLFTLSLLSPFLYCKRQKKCLHHPHRGSEGLCCLIQETIYTWFLQPAAVEGQQERDDVRTGDFYASVTQLYSGNWQHLLSEYSKVKYLYLYQSTMDPSVVNAASSGMCACNN